MNHLQDNSKRLLEISTPLLNSEQAYVLASSIVGTGFFVRKHDRAVVAEIACVIINPMVFICELTVSDPDLDFMFDDPEEVYKNYIEVDFSHIFNYQ